MSDASFKEQLLTALFDGELRGAERERAEQLLAENSEYKRLFESWQTQSAGLRDLPRYQLDDRFATKVMRQIDSQPVLNPVTGAMTNWQTGFAAMATLAAMLLLTLFVFPNVADLNPVARLTDNKTEAEGFSADRAGSESDVEKSIVSKPDEADVAKPDEKTGELRDSSTLNKKLAGADVGIMNRGGNHDANEQAKPGARKSKLAEFAEKSLSGAGLHAAPSSKSSPLGRGLNMDANEAVAIDYQVSKVEQILWIDMRHREQPMAEVETVFAKNSIPLLNSATDQMPINGLGQQRMANDKMAPPSGAGARTSKNRQQGRVFSNQSDSGMEALFVVATAEQMRQAIVELSDQANIAGYQVPQSQFQRGRAGRGSVARADSTAGNVSPTDPDAARQQADQPQSVQSIGRSSGGLAAQTKEQGIGVPVASAQQLVPYQLGNPQVATRNESSNRAEEPGQELAREIREIDSWFRLPNRQSDSELVQYLLLVRTSAEDFGIAPARESADMEPGNEGSSDK